MIIRPYNPDHDRTPLHWMALQSGFPYPELDSPLIEACLVVEDDEGHIMAAITAKRLVELYMHKREGLRPSVSKSILDAMHREMAKTLRTKGYTSAEAFLPPSICERFGRRLERTFGWVKNWPSYCVRF